MEKHPAAIDEYVTNMDIYEDLFLPDFPKLKFKSRKDGFIVNGTKVRYTEISDMRVEKPFYLIIEIKKRRQLFLPLLKTVSFKKIDLNPGQYRRFFSFGKWVRKIKCLLSLK